MEVVEILIYAGIAIVVSGLVIAFIADWDVEGLYFGLSKKMTGSKEMEFQKVDKTVFASRVNELFRKCKATGSNHNLTLYVKGNGTLEKNELFDIYKEMGWCDSIQSATNDCGEEEDVVMESITLPKIVRVSCTTEEVSIK